MRHKRLKFFGSLISLSCLALLLLSACSSTATPPVVDEPTPTPTSTPTPTPTPALKNTMGTADFTIGYPDNPNWEKHEGDAKVSYDEKNDNGSIEVGVKENNNTDLEEQLTTWLATFEKQTTGFQHEPAKDVTIGGETWKLITWSGKATEEKNKGKLAKGGSLITRHNNKIFLINYGAYDEIFDQANSTIFQPMLASFAFK